MIVVPPLAWIFSMCRSMKELSPKEEYQRRWIIIPLFISAIFTPQIIPLIMPLTDIVELNESLQNIVSISIGIGVYLFFHKLYEWGCGKNHSSTQEIVNTLINPISKIK